MRVHRLRKSDEGAVAVLVALLSVVLIGVAAFTVDFGATYLTKRDLSNGTDAASLAAAKDLATHSGTCLEIGADGTATSAARTTGDGYLQDNLSGATRTGFDVGCDATGSVTVRYAGEALTDRALGGVFGGSGKYDVAREATSTVGVASDVNGLRPYMICFSDLPTLELGGVQRINYPSATCGNQAGNWYSTDCPGDGNNGTQTLADNTLNGCDTDISIIDTTAAAGVSTQIISILKANCPKLQADPGCLTANTGNLASNNIENAWIALLGKDILLPVFYPGSLVGNGNNTRYPVYNFAGVTVCGYHWQSKSGLSTATACTGSSWQNGNYDALLLKLTKVITSGSTHASTCKLGDITCDFGARVVHLVK
ncbi:MAG: pilus assembly protein TadG-related protein [Mycobacteriales bacterium]